MSFKNIIGQDKAIRIIRDSAQDFEVSSSYLFIGPQGLGKFLTAKTLAKAVNCLEEKMDACDRCASCLKIEKNQHPDVHIIDACLSNSAEPDEQSLQGQEKKKTEAVKIEQIRQLQKEANLKPYEARKKVFIINDAHNLTEEAANALLKTLEEPPRDSLIIMVTAKPQLLLKTVISRCRRIKFYPLPRATLQDLLSNEYSVEASFAHFLAYFCEGRIGQALALKDTGIFNEKNKIIDEFVLEEHAAFGYRRDLQSQDLRKCMNILVSWFRDIYMLKVGMPHAELVNFDRRDELLESMSGYSIGALDDITRFISEAFLYLEQNINPKLVAANLKIGYLAGHIV